jgi:putative ubiquitin-RnfH superfamily antitoxin RatB of RatAB toxin-antitoxin module
MRFTAKHPMSEFEVEIVFALPDRQSLQSIPVASGETVADVVAKSGLREDYPEIEIDSLAVGIWGREADRTQHVKEGDRIEVYRPLEMDPREARRQLAQSGRTMGSADRD